MKIRQQAPELSGIRDDHVNRYKFAIDAALKEMKTGTVLDVGCGVGYGSKMFSDAGFNVTGIDLNQGAIDYANEHYQDGQIKFQVQGMEDFDPTGFDIITMFEVIEHSEQAPSFMAMAAPHARLLFGSVPNENIVPFATGGYNTEHYRHYTPEEIWDEIIGAGWEFPVMGSQEGKIGAKAKVRLGHRHGRTLVFSAKGENL